MKIAELLELNECWYEHIPHQATYSAQRLAQELHVPGPEVAKTVLLRADSNGEHEFVVAVLPANKNIDFDRVAELINSKKVQLATELEIGTRCPDCEFGVLPPFGSRYGMKTIVDSALAQDEEIWFEGNSHIDAFRMKFNDFKRLEQPVIATFAAGK
jgi:Ala-tRNA(Pro) deacylase